MFDMRESIPSSYLRHSLLDAPLHREECLLGTSNQVQQRGRALRCCVGFRKEMKMKFGVGWRMPMRWAMVWWMGVGAGTLETARRSRQVCGFEQEGGWGSLSVGAENATGKGRRMRCSSRRRKRWWSMGAWILVLLTHRSVPSSYAGGENQQDAPSDQYAERQDVMNELLVSAIPGVEAIVEHSVTYTIIGDELGVFKGRGMCGLLWTATGNETRSREIFWYEYNRKEEEGLSFRILLAKSNPFVKPSSRWGLAKHKAKEFGAFFFGSARMKKQSSMACEALHSILFYADNRLCSQQHLLFHAFYGGCTLAYVVVREKLEDNPPYIQTFFHPHVYPQLQIPHSTQLK